MSMIQTRLEAVEQALTRALEREACSSDVGCSALANVLLTALVKCKRDPRVSANVADEMRRLAAKLIELASACDESLSRVLRESKLN